MEGLLYTPGSMTGPGDEQEVGFICKELKSRCEMGRQTHNQIITNCAQWTWGPWGGNNCVCVRERVRWRRGQGQFHRGEAGGADHWTFAKWASGKGYFGQREHPVQRNAVLVHVAPHAIASLLSMLLNSDASSSRDWQHAFLRLGGSLGITQPKSLVSQRWNLRCKVLRCESCSDPQSTVTKCVPRIFIEHQLCIRQFVNNDKLNLGFAPARIYFSLALWCQTNRSLKPDPVTFLLVTLHELLILTETKFPLIRMKITLEYSS